MDSNASGPVVLSEEEKSMLSEGIGLILSRWTAMRAAVENGWGGRDSQGKAERTISKVFDYFIQSKDPLDFDGLADILEGGLSELNTVADDGSLEEVTEKLLDLYEECLAGNYQTVEKLRVANSQLSASVVKVSNGNDEEEDDESDDDDDNDESTDMMVEASDQNQNQNLETIPKIDEATATKAEGDDGWTVVPSRKNKGKRN